MIAAEAGREEAEKDGKRENVPFLDTQPLIDSSQ